MRKNEFFESKYLAASDLDGKEITVKVSNVEAHELGGEKKAVMFFAGKKKGMVMNKTKWAAMEALFRSDDSDDWIGQTITIYPGKAMYRGEQVDAIYIQDRFQKMADKARKRIAAKQQAEEEPPPPGDGDIPAEEEEDEVPF